MFASRIYAYKDTLFRFKWHDTAMGLLLKNRNTIQFQKNTWIKALYAIIGLALTPLHLFYLYLFLI